MNQALLYSKYNGLQKNDANYILENYFRLVKWNPEAEENALDVGCGSGDITMKLLLPMLPKTLSKLTGADLSAEMVEFASTQNKDERVEFVRMDIAAKEILEEFEEEFNHIFSFYCLHWIQDQRQALSNLYQLLKPGGDMLITYLATNPIFHIYQNLASNKKWMKYIKNTNKYLAPYQNTKNPEKEIEKLLADIGFNAHLCKVLERKYTYTDVKAFKKSVIAVNPFIGKIPEELHNDYLMDFIDEVKNLNYVEYNDNNNEEKVCFPYRLIIIYASKSEERKC